MLEERTKRIDERGEKMALTLEEIRLMLAQKRGAENALANMRNLVTVLISTAITGVGVLVQWWGRR